jgi:hypothetical protein
MTTEREVVIDSKYRARKQFRRFHSGLTTEYQIHDNVIAGAFARDFGRDRGTACCRWVGKSGAAMVVN